MPIKRKPKRHHSFLLIMVAILATMTIACDRTSTIETQMKEAESLILSAPDSATSILESILFKEASGMNDRQKAYLSILLAKAKISQGKTFLTDEYFDSSISYLESVSDTVRLIDIYQLASIKKRWLRQQDSAAFYLSKAIDLVNDSSAGFKSKLYIKLSNLFAYPTLPKDYQTALKYAKLALSTAKSSTDKARALHDIGLFYSYLNYNDSALIFMEEALNESDPSDQEFETYALNYSCLPNIDINKGVTQLRQIKGEHLGKMISLGFLYLNHSRLDSAKTYLTESKRLYHQDPSKYSINTHNSLRLLEESLRLLNSGTVECGEGSVPNDSINQILDVRLKHSNEQKEKNNQLQIRLLESKAQRQQTWIIALCALFFVTVCFGLYVWNAKRKMLKLKAQLDNVKIEQIVAEAADQYSNESDAAKNLIRKRLDLCIEQFRASKLQAEIDKMELQYISCGNYPTIKCRGAVQKELIGCFADFIVDLKMTGAKLTVDDIITCLMSCLQESNAATAACLGTTETSVRTRKSRLRDKLPSDILELLRLKINN